MPTDSSLFRRLLWNVMPLVVVVTLVLTTLMGDDGLLHRHADKQQLRSAQHRVVALQAENARLRAAVAALRTDPQVVIRAAADKLLVAPAGSTIYRFEPPEP